jgi:hypothetical protein
MFLSSGTLEIELISAELSGHAPAALGRVSVPLETDELIPAAICDFPRRR